MNPIFDRDEKGRVTHERWINGSERWYDYDADGRTTHYRWSDGTERWFDYDADGHMTPIAGATASTGIRKATTKRRTNDTVR